MAAIADQNPPAPAHARHTRRALRAARGRLQKHALKLLGRLVFAFLLLKLLPSLKRALHSLEHVGWPWVLGAIALEVVSEFGFVRSWRSIVDPDDLLGRDGRGVRVSTHAAWAQLDGGMVVPGGSLASIGVGAWILRRFGMPAKTIAERQFNLSFLNTGVDALALILFGIGLATGIFPGERNLVLTLLPAVLAMAGIAAVLLVSRVGARYGERPDPLTRRLPARSARWRTPRLPPSGSSFIASDAGVSAGRSNTWASMRSLCGRHFSRSTPARFPGSRSC